MVSKYRLYRQFTEACRELDGTLVRRGGEYICIVKRTENLKTKKYNFILNLSYDTVPIQIYGYEFNNKDKNLKIIGYSLAYLNNIFIDKDVLDFISGTGIVIIRISKKPLDVQIVVKGRTVDGKYYTKIIDEKYIKEIYDPLLSAVYFTACEHIIENKEIKCRMIPLQEAIYYSEKIEKTRPSLLFLSEDPEFRSLIAIAHKKEIYEAIFIDSLLNEHRGLENFLEIFHKVLEEEQFKELLEKDWKILLISSSSDLSRYYKVPARGLTIHSDKIIAVSLGETYPHNTKELARILVHELVHAYREEKRLREEYGEWVYDETTGKFIPVKEEKVVDELTSKIISRIFGEKSI